MFTRKSFQAEKHMSHFRLLIFCYLSILSMAIRGQELFPIQNFAPDVYHGETQNWNICQAPDKNIYTANNKGLIEYNGSAWKLYPSPNHTIMRSVNVHGNLIYTGCYMEFGYWQRDEFLNLRYTSLSSGIKDKLLDDEHFWKILCYRQWVLFQSLHRIYVYNTISHSFEIITSKTTLPKVFEAGNQVYFQKMDEGLFQLVNGKSSLVSDSPIFKKNIIINIFSKSNRLLIQTQEKGFFTFERNEISAWQSDAASKIGTLSVYCSLQLRDGCFVLGTIGEGLYILSPDGKITMHIDKKNGLQNNTILSLFEDADNDIWLGLDNGISQLNYTSPYRVYTDTKGIFGAVYASALYQGNLYLGTNQGLFYRALKSADDFKIVEGTKGQVWTLKIIDGTLFCGHNSGTFIIKDNKAALISTIFGTWDIKPIPNTLNLLIQGNYEGLHILEKKNGNWQYRNKIEGFDISSRYFDVLPGNQIFVNHEYRGVFKLDVSGDFSKITKYEREPGALLSIYSGMAKYNGKLLYFCDSGLYKLSRETNHFRKESLLNKSVLGDDSYLSGKLIEDGNQMMWAFTEENMILMSPGKLDNEPQITRVALPLSLRENVVGFENLLHLGNKNYILGTTNGYILFDLAKITDEECTVYINSIDKSKLNGSRTYIAGQAKKYKLNANENNLSFSFNVPVYDRFKLTKFQYILEGMYDNWSEWSKESKVSFKNLPSGEYTFKVRARVGNKLTSNIASFSFTVTKPWYLSVWMKLVYAVVFVLVLVVINHLYHMRYMQQKEKNDQEAKKKLAMLKLETEKEIVNLKNENLNCEIEAISVELATTNMAIVKKNELLNTIKYKLQQEKDNQNVKSALKIIEENLETNADWNSFQKAFDNADRDFLKKLKEMHPLLTPSDLKLCAYLRLNISSKEIAPLLNISAQSVEIKRFRLRKKMDLSHEQNLTEYILNI